MTTDNLDPEKLAALLLAGEIDISDAELEAVLSATGINLEDDDDDDGRRDPTPTDA